MSLFTISENKLVRKYDSETLWVESWGKDALRVRACHNATMQDEDWALLPPASCSPSIEILENKATIKNGKITAEITNAGTVTFFNDKGEELLKEYVRNRRTTKEFCSALNIDARELKPILNGDYDADDALHVSIDYVGRSRVVADCDCRYLHTRNSPYCWGIRSILQYDTRDIPVGIDLDLYLPFSLRHCPLDRHVDPRGLYNEQAYCSGHKSGSRCGKSIRE